MTLGRRLVDLNRGSFNRAEAAFYEVLSAGAVRAIVAPVLIDLLRDTTRGRVLDVGCGSGDLTQDLGNASRDVIGVDPSVAQLHRLRRRHAFPCAAAPAGALPFPDAAFAAVLSSCSVKHWPSLLDGLAECARVVAPGGVVAVVEIDAGTNDDELLRFAAMARVPPGLRRVYRAMARRSFVPLTPSPDQVADGLTSFGLGDADQRRVAGLPFYVVSAQRPLPT